MYTQVESEQVSIRGRATPTAADHEPEWAFQGDAGSDNPTILPVEQLTRLPKLKNWGDKDFAVFECVLATKVPVESGSAAAPK